MEGLLIITAKSCKLTRDTEKIGKMDPYCALQVRDQKCVTSIKDNAGTTCSWEETFTFIVHENDKLTYSVYDDEQWRSDQLVGENYFQIKMGPEDFGKKLRSFPLSFKNIDAGELDLEYEIILNDKKLIEEIKTLQNQIFERNKELEQFEQRKPSKPVEKKRLSAIEAEINKNIEEEKIINQELEKKLAEMTILHQEKYKELQAMVEGTEKNNQKAREEIEELSLKFEKIKQPIIGGTITIKCLKAVVNRDIDKLGKMDPYVTFYIGESKVSTKAHDDGGKAPIWNETLKIKRNNESILNFTIYDKNTVHEDRLMGYGSKSLYNSIYLSQNEIESKEANVLYAGQIIEKISITFDDENRIRVLDSDKYRETDLLKNESMEFIKKIMHFDESMTLLLESLDSHAAKIEQVKLRALGERNKVDTEEENRKKKMQELHNLINEKKSELERLTIEMESLQKVESEQKALIEKLTNNETN